MFCQFQGCGVQFRPDKDSTGGQKNLCWEHRYSEKTKKRFRMTPAQKKAVRDLAKKREVTDSEIVRAQLQKLVIKKI